tara:strand:- start:2277 stop:2777 length:501 start_codon:yes stop_codon:yes gene_type:complete
LLPRDTNDFGEDFDDANTEEEDTKAVVVGVVAVAKKSPRVFTNTTDDDPSSKTPPKPQKQPPNDDDPRRRTRRRRWCFMMMKHKGGGFCIAFFSPLLFSIEKKGQKKENQTLKRVVVCLGFYNFLFGQKKSSLSLFPSFFSLSRSIERTLKELERKRPVRLSNRRA